MKPTLHLLQCTALLTLLLSTAIFSAKGQCPVPEGFILNNITSSTVDASWNTAIGAIRYEYAIGTDTTAPSGGISVTSTNAAIQGLSHDTKYCLHLRTVCASEYSDWTRQCFVTTCDGINVADLLVDMITGTTARGKWKPFPSGISYEYVIDQSANPPTSNTTYTTATSIMFQGLTQDENYCLHVRSLCAVSNTYTDWATTCFKTPPPPNDVASIYNSNAVSIYPNPVNDVLNINIDGLTDNHSLVIRDITGRTVLQTELQQENTNFSLTSVTAGIYFVNISGAAINTVQRIVKE